MKIKLNPAQLDKAIVKDLKNAVLRRIGYHGIDDEDYTDALMVTLRYYMNDVAYQKFLKKFNKANKDK